MQHINEAPPRVSQRRLDVSPRLDAAVARSLAKRPEDRFATMADFGRELEACLAEARAGGGASETMVLSRPRLRRPRRFSSAPLLVALGLVIAAAVLVVALTLGGSSSSPSLAAGIHLRAVAAYDPPPGDGVEDNARLPLATDGSPGTFWATEHYANEHFGNLKNGVGIVLAAGGNVTVSRLTVTTDTPGFTAEIQAGDSPGGPFHAVSSPQIVNSETTFDLRNARASYFVVWITNLAPLSQAHVNEVTAS